MEDFWVYEIPVANKHVFVYNERNYKLRVDDFW